MEQSSDFLPRKKAQQRLGEWHWQDEEFATEYPAVYQILASARMDGAYRVGGSITLFCDTQELKFVISDRQTDQSLFGTLDAAKSIWEQLEAFVRNHPDDWRAKKVDDKNRR